jgi:hypothetical protein
MSDPMNPTLMTKVRAALAHERDSVVLEAMRAAGRVAHDELMAAERLREDLVVAGTTLWDAPPAVASQLLASWNAFVLQTLGETLLDADYAADPGTVGFVPEATFNQASVWLSAVEGWVSRARQARSNPEYDIAAELALPAGLPAWAEVGPCPPAHLAALQAAVPPVRDRVEFAVYALERACASDTQTSAVNRLRQLIAEAATAADYAAGLRTTRQHAGLHELIENNLRDALELWFHVGQLAAMPRLLDHYRSRRPLPRPELARLPGGSRFDPWCLTDQHTVREWQRDPQARHAIKELWRHDPDPAKTLALKAEIDAAEAAGDIVRHRVRGGVTCYFECPWAPLYEVRRPVRVAGRQLRVLQQFAMRVAADEVPRGGRFVRDVVIGPFQETDEVEYCDPDDGH